MDSKVTVSVRSMLLAGLVLLGLAGGVPARIGGETRRGARERGGGTVRAGSGPAHRGDVRDAARRAPCRTSCRSRSSVALTRDRPRRALADASATMTRVLASLKELRRREGRRADHRACR